MSRFLQVIINKEAGSFLIPKGSISCWKFFLHFRDWSLFTGRGGGTKREGGHVNFDPYERGGGQQRFKPC